MVSRRPERTAGSCLFCWAICIFVFLKQAAPHCHAFNIFKQQKSSCFPPSCIILHITSYLLPKIAGIYQYTEILDFFLSFLLDFFVPAPQNTALYLYPLYCLDLLFFSMQIFTTQALSLRESWQMFFWIQVESRCGAIFFWNKIWIKIFTFKMSKLFYYSVRLHIIPAYEGASFIPGDSTQLILIITKAIPNLGQLCQIYSAVNRRLAPSQQDSCCPKRGI